MIVSPDTEFVEKLQDLRSWEGGASRVGFMVKQVVSVLILTKSVGIGGCYPQCLHDSWPGIEKIGFNDLVAAKVTTRKDGVLPEEMVS